MMRLFHHAREAARKRARYTRTVAELRKLPLDTLLDLDIHRGDAARIARHAVYGR